VLDVADNGPGIPPEIRPRVFEPYVTTRRVGEGMGLGLAISKKILLDHGGDLEVLASSGAGTTLFTNPMMRASSALNLPAEKKISLANAGPTARFRRRGRPVVRWGPQHVLPARRPARARRPDRGDRRARRVAAARACHRRTRRDRDPGARGSSRAPERPRRRAPRPRLARLRSHDGARARAGAR